MNLALTPGCAVPRVAVAPRPSAAHDAVVKLTLDLHDIHDRGDEIDRALHGVLAEAARRKARRVEIIPGKGSGQLRKRVRRFLDRKDIRPLYLRVERDHDNVGRVFVLFRWE